MTIESGKTARPLGKLVPNPKARLRDQFHEVCRFKYFSERTEDSYWQRIHRCNLFHGEPHSSELGGPEVRALLPS